jgi:hypothetical protein
MGRENMTIKSMVKLAHVLGIRVTDLFKKPKTKQPGPGRPKKKPTKG